MPDAHRGHYALLTLSLYTWSLLRSPDGRALASAWKRRRAGRSTACSQQAVLRTVGRRLRLARRRTGVQKRSRKDLFWTPEIGPLEGPIIGPSGPRSQRAQWEPGAPTGPSNGPLKGSILRDLKRVPFKHPFERYTASDTRRQCTRYGWSRTATTCWLPPPAPWQRGWREPTVLYTTCRAHRRPARRRLRPICVAPAGATVHYTTCSAPASPWQRAGGSR